MPQPIGLYVMAILCVTLEVTACHRAGSPGEVQQDVRKADRSALRDIAGAEQKKDARIAAANADAALARAEGDHKVAMAQCEAQAGDARKACTDRADAELEAARARAKDIRAGAS